ncbi:MAG: ParB/RepB/Spo0J family partition protein [Bacteroidota bacterium]
MKSPLGLGKGLSALIPGNAENQNKSQDSNEGLGIGLIDITKIKTNPYQPRVIFDPQALEELVESIKLHGVIQPITVRKSTGNTFELISGERRIRASIEAGLDQIPAFIMDIDTNEAMIELAIIENVQRENLNDIEIAMGYQMLIDQCDLTQEEVAAKVGKDRATVSNFLRLLKLPSDIQQKVALKEITNGHARALLSLQSPDNQRMISDRIVNEQLSVRETEEIIRELMGVTKKSTKKATKKRTISPSQKQPLSNDLLALEDALREHFTTQVSISLKDHENGKVEITFFSLDDLQRVIDLIIPKD